jgi:hypothetical protein
MTGESASGLFPIPNHRSALLYNSYHCRASLCLRVCRGPVMPEDRVSVGARPGRVFARPCRRCIVTLEAEKIP